MLKCTAKRSLIPLTFEQHDSGRGEGTTAFQIQASWVSHPGLPVGTERLPRAELCCKAQRAMVGLCLAGSFSLIIRASGRTWIPSLS